MIPHLISFTSTLLSFLVFGSIQLVFSQSPLTVENGDLKAVFIDNSPYGEHRKGYNGISELYHSNQDSTLFVPFYAGFNLEHIFGGDSLVSLFEPRKEPMTIKRLTRNKVLLHQPTTSISGVESWTTFELIDPHYIDVEFRFVVHEPSFFSHNYIGIFWASYIHQPENLGIYFKGYHKKNQGEGRWLYAYSKDHGYHATHIGHKDHFQAFMAPDFNVTLARGMSDYRFTSPYYYGRFHNMVFGYMFAVPGEGFIRMTQSPSGGGSGNPAWDFQYILPDFEAGKPYSFKTRVFYKEWVSQEDIEQEYNKWKEK